MPAKSVDALTRAELVAALRRFNPFGGYCEHKCKHPGHTDDAYRATVRRLRGGRNAA